MILKHDKIDDIVYVDEIDHIDGSKNMTLWSKFNMMKETHTWMNVGHMVGNWQIKYSKGNSKSILNWRLDKTYSAYQILYMKKIDVMEKINYIQLCGQAIDIEWHQMKFLTQINWLHVLTKMF
jgi:hypothetical protein